MCTPVIEAGGGFVFVRLFGFIMPSFVSLQKVKLIASLEPPSKMLVVSGAKIMNYYTEECFIAGIQTKIVRQVKPINICNSFPTVMF